MDNDSKISCILCISSIDTDGQRYNEMCVYSSREKINLRRLAKAALAAIKVKVIQALHDKPAMAELYDTFARIP